MKHTCTLPKPHPNPTILTTTHDQEHGAALGRGGPHVGAAGPVQALPHGRRGRAALHARQPLEPPGPGRYVWACLIGGRWCFVVVAACAGACGGDGVGFRGVGWSGAWFVRVRPSAPPPPLSLSIYLSLSISLSSRASHRRCVFETPQTRRTATPSLTRWTRCWRPRRSGPTATRYGWNHT